MRNKYWLLLAVVILINLDQEIFAQGCSQCKLLSEQGSELDENSFGSNINFGILYLMAVPYILLLFLFRRKIVSIFKSVRKG